VPPFLAVALTRKGGFDALLFTWLQIKGVSFDLFDYVFLKHFALKASKRTFQGLAFVKMNFSQRDLSLSHAQGKTAPSLPGAARNGLMAARLALLCQCLRLRGALAGILHHISFCEHDRFYLRVPFEQAPT